MVFARKGIVLQENTRVYFDHSLQSNTTFDRTLMNTLIAAILRKNKNIVNVKIVAIFGQFLLIIPLVLLPNYVDIA